MNVAFASLIGALFFGAALDDASEPARKPPQARPKAVDQKPEANRPPPLTLTPGKGGAPAPLSPPAAPPAASRFPEGPAGTMELPETVYDAGQVERGTEIKHTFVVKNTGKHPLHIEAKAG